MYAFSSKNLFGNFLNKNKTITVENPILLDSELETDSEKQKRIKNNFFEAMKLKLSFAKLFIIDELHFSLEANDVSEEVLKDQIVTISLLSELLKNNKMIGNIYSIQVTVKNENQMINLEYAIDLKMNGIHWAILFSKHVQNQFLNSFENMHLIQSELSGAGSRIREKYIFKYGLNFKEIPTIVNHADATSDDPNYAYANNHVGYTQGLNQ